MEVLKFRDGYRGSGDPVKITAELEKIRKRTGALTPEETLAVAANKSSPLHDEFEWDDSVAGREWRLEQARRLIRAVIVVRSTDSIPKYIHVTKDESRPSRYERLVDVIKDSDALALALAELSRKLDAAIRAVLDVQAVTRKQSKAWLAADAILSELRSSVAHVESAKSKGVKDEQA